MDVELRTYCASPALAFRELERWAEKYPEIPAGWRAQLHLRSGAFAAALPFYFDQRVLDAFLRDLAHMDRTLTGSATLATPYEDPRITFTVGPNGGVLVTGLLLDYEHDLRRLEFEFRTDQTVLRPLADDFADASRILAAAVPVT